MKKIGTGIALRIHGRHTTNAVGATPVIPVRDFPGPYESPEQSQYGNLAIKKA
jgi:hypothetical protein